MKFIFGNMFIRFYLLTIYKTQFHISNTIADTYGSTILDLNQTTLS